jgi:hypothetical protein
MAHGIMRTKTERHMRKARRAEMGAATAGMARAAGTMRIDRRLKAVGGQAGSRAAGPAASLVRWLRRGDRSAVSMELGIIAIPFFVMFLGVMEISYDLFVQATLDNATETAARSVQVGSTTGNNSQSNSAYVSSNVCPNLGPLLDCALLEVAVVPVPFGFNYWSLPLQSQLNEGQIGVSTGTGIGNGICTGVGGQMMLLKAWYNGPTFLGALVPYFATTWNNVVVHLTTSSAAFVNEYFTGGQATGTACGT